MDPVLFQVFNQSGVDVPFSGVQLKNIVKLLKVHEQRNFLCLEVVFVDDNEILDMNREYLGHDHLTDIITFPYHVGSSASVEGTLFCCATQIKRQSTHYGTTYENEVIRVVIHGLLHLIGYDDRSDNQRSQMRSLENKYITLYQDL